MNRILCLFLPLLVLSGFCFSPIQTFAAQGERIELKSECAVLMDGDTGQVLYAKNPNQQMAPASITKIMTALLAVENADMSDTITMSETAVFNFEQNISHIGLIKGEQLTVEQALYATMLMSANDATNGVAEHVGGSIPEFAKMMTARANELGARNTNFVNANGLDDPMHYTSAYDMALITKEAIKHPDFLKVFGTPTYELPPTNLQKEARPFTNQHYMLWGSVFFDENVIGGKVGWTDEAGHTLVTVSRKDGRTLISVVLKSTPKYDKYKDTIALFDYGYNQFKRVIIPQNKIKTIELDRLSNNGVTFIPTFKPTGDYTLWVNKTASVGSINVDYIIPENYDLNGPEQIMVTFSTDTSGDLESYLGEFPMQRQFVLDKTQTDTVVLSEKKPAEKPAEKPPVQWKTILTQVGTIVGIIAGILVVLFILLLFLRAYIRQKYRKKLHRTYRNQTKVH